MIPSSFLPTLAVMVASYASLLLPLAIIGFGGVAAIVVRRLLFQPLTNIPGPKLAAVTAAYEFYYDCILIGRFHFKINELHERYGKLKHVIEVPRLTVLGPIVRISPREVHIRDPEFFDKIYNVTNKFSKDTWYYRFLDSPQGALSTESAELHRMRRKGMNRFFSPNAIRRLSQPIMSNVEMLCKRLDAFKETGEPANLSNAYGCLVTDNTTDYVLPHGYNMLGNEDFASDFNRQTRVFVIASL